MLSRVFWSQSFKEEILPKIESLRNSFKFLDIQVDGGIYCENVNQVAKAGANCIVSSTGIFGHDDRCYAVNYMREVVQKYQ